MAKLIPYDMNPHLSALLQQLPSQLVHLPLEHIDIGHRGLENVQLALEVIQLDLQHADLIQAIAVLDLALGKSALLDLDLLVQQCELVIPPAASQSKETL